MVLSNAERQARYRERIKARANDAGAAARAAADNAAAAIWAMFNRIGEASVAEFPKFDDWRASLGADLAGTCRGLINNPELTPDELVAIRAVVAIDDALDLKHAKGA